MSQQRRWSMPNQEIISPQRSVQLAYTLGSITGVAIESYYGDFIPHILSATEGMDHKSATFYKRSADGMFNSILSCHGVDSLPPILCNPLLCHPMQSWKQIPSPPPSLKVVLATSKIVFPLLFLLLFNLGILSSVYGRGLLLNSISIMISPYMYMTSKGKGFSYH